MASPDRPTLPNPNQLLQTLTVEQFQMLIRFTVEELLLEFLGDPDEGLTLKPEVQARLLEQQADRQRTGEIGFSTQQVLRELGLE
ncbi:MAG: hypothetical protein VKK80_14190 [Prochlorothrix sp.]|nr:hypothetical protein [Prochlorothrix sp.]